MDGPFNAVALGDCDGDEAEEIVCASFASESGYDDGLVYVFDAETHVLEWRSDPGFFESFAWTGLHVVAIGDVDGDPAPEILVGTDRLYDGRVYVIDGATHVLEQTYELDEGAPVYSLAVGDVDKDGAMEVVAGAGREHTGAPGVYVYVIDGATGVVEWHSISLGDYWSTIEHVAIGDVDGDTVPEIVALNDRLFVFDGVTHQQWQTAAGGYTALDLFDLEGDGAPEIWVGTTSGDLVAIDGLTQAEELSLNVAAGGLETLVLREMELGRGAAALFCRADRFYVYDVAGTTLAWQSEPLGLQVGEGNGLAVGDGNEAGTTRAVIGSLHVVCELQSEPFTPVLLSGLAVRREGDEAVVSWQTAGTASASAFHIWRQLGSEERLRISEQAVSGLLDWVFTDPSAPAGAAGYWLQELETGGSERWHGPALLAAASANPAAASELVAYPNPGNPGTTLAFTLAKPGPVLLSVHDARGRLLRLLVAGELDAGPQLFTWDGHDDAGRPLASGVYLARLSTHDETVARKLVLAR